MYDADAEDFTSVTVMENRMIRLFEENTFDIDMSGIVWMAPHVAREFMQAVELYDFTLHNVNTELRALLGIYGTVK